MGLRPWKHSLRDTHLCGGPCGHGIAFRKPSATRSLMSVRLLGMLLAETSATMKANFAKGLQEYYGITAVCGRDGSSEQDPLPLDGPAYSIVHGAETNNQ
eukprot:2334972-Amphidinium_carterae.1